MNIYVDSSLKAGLPLLLQETSTLTTKQLAISKIALCICAFVLTLYLCFKLDSMRGKVTVIETDGTTYTDQIENINGAAKVIFNGFLGSGATIEGKFRKGLLNGPGKEIFPDGNIAEQEGEYEDGWLCGAGKVTYRNGKVEAGTYKHGVLIDD